jgi:hypothetical protein
MGRIISSKLTALSLGIWCIGTAETANAAFHLIQIEQVIGGINGDTTAQAIQLRMRSAGQNLMQFSRIRAWDAAGQNPVLIVDMTTSVSNSLAGDRVLIASPAFSASTNPLAVVDFAMAALIPESYLAAGSLTFEEDDGVVYWRLSWGGAGYTGSTFGASDNDNDPGTAPANFGPPIAGQLPSVTLQAIKFQGAAGALSTTNVADYALTTGAAVFINNARSSFTVVAPDVDGDIDGDQDVDTADWSLCFACLAGPDGDRPQECSGADFLACDLTDDSDVDLVDIADFVLLFSDP